MTNTQIIWKEAWYSDSCNIVNATMLYTSLAKYRTALLSLANRVGQRGTHRGITRKMIYSNVVYLLVCDFVSITSHSLFSAPLGMSNAQICTPFSGYCCTLVWGWQLLVYLYLHIPIRTGRQPMAVSSLLLFVSNILLFYEKVGHILPEKIHWPMHYKIGVTCVYNGHVFYTLL